jgi:hypothetical protein
MTMDLERDASRSIITPYTCVLELEYQTWLAIIISLPYLTYTLDRYVGAFEMHRMPCPALNTGTYGVP